MNESRSLREFRRLVKFTHDRCDEYDGSEYLFAPAGWTDEQIREAKDAVVKEMIADAEAVQKSPLRPPHQPPYAEHPDKTVAEVQALHGAQRAAYEAWRQENIRLVRSFSERLRERGFIGTWEKEAPTFKVGVWWGHKHGLDLNYEHSTL